MKRILISPGHRSRQPGAVNNGVKEYFLALDVIRKTKKAIDNMNIPNLELMVIEDSKSLSQKIKDVNKLKPDIAIELHWNACNNDSVYGSEAFYMKGSSNSEKLAHHYCIIFEKVSGIRSRGPKPDNMSQYSRLAWCRDTVCPAVLVENEFITWSGFHKDYFELISVAAMVRFIKDLV
jgi:N-acetylmuramoyl-L-alanine amidase